MNNSAETAESMSLDLARAEAIEEQRRAIFDAQAIIEVTALALHQQYGDWPEGTPAFDRPLQTVGRMLDDAASALEDGPLEERMRSILRDWEAKP